MKPQWFVFLSVSLVLLGAGMGASPSDPQPTKPAAQQTAAETGFAFLNTSFENASPLSWEVDREGAIQISLLYDHERSSPNRAAGHWHFQVQAKPGSKLTLVLNNFDNIWNGKHAAPISAQTISVISPNGRDWSVIPTKLLPGARLQLNLTMPGPILYVARLEPYRLSDLERLLNSITGHPWVERTPIGKTVEGRTLEMVRIGNPQAPYHVLLRARAHPWEPGGNWVLQGLIQRLLQDDATARQYRERYCVHLLPMANMDGVVRGRTRFNMQGCDLNRNWDKPADPVLAPENHGLESWIAARIQKGERLHLVLDLHNDEGGRLHISRPEQTDTRRYLARMQTLERLLRQDTWFTEGSTPESFHNPGTIGEGLLARYGIHAAIHELNANWIAGLKDYPTGKHWETYGRQLCQVFFDYFGSERP